MSEEKIRELYASGKCTWGDLLEITGLHTSELYGILWDLINPKFVDPNYDPAGK